MQTNKYFLKSIVSLLFLCTMSSLSAQGTLLFKEDFGGNNISDPVFATSDVSGGYSDFIFQRGNMEDEGVYTLAKYVTHAGGAWWANNNDHTYWGDRNRGYYMFVNPQKNSVGKIFYQKRIDGLCDGVKVQLSAWVLDLCIGAVTALVPPKFKLRISDAVAGTVLTETGVITATRWATASAVKWEQLTLQVTIPVGVTSINFTVINQEASTAGNDLGLDDIQVYLVTNDVNTTANGSSSTNITLVDDSQTINFTGNYVNDGALGTNLTSYWTYSTTGDITSLSDWTPIDENSGVCSVNSTYTHNFSLMNAKPGYYRLVIGQESQVLSTLCRAGSQVIHVQ